MRPTLSQILQPGKEYLIFLSAEIEFHKLTDINDKMSIILFNSILISFWMKKGDAFALGSRSVVIELYNSRYLGQP